MDLPGDGMIDFVDIVKHQSSVLQGMFKEIVCKSGRNKLKIVFDENALVKEEIEKHSDGFIFKNLYSYSNGKVICVTRTMNNEVLWNSNYHYETDGYYVEIDDTHEKKYSTGRITHITRYKFNPINHFTTKIIEIGDSLRYTYTFDADGILVNLYYEDGRSTQPILTRIGNEIKVEKFERDNPKVSIIQTLRYSDENKLLLYENQYLQEKKTVRFEYIYNDAGMLEKLTRNGKTVSTISYHT